MARWDLVTVRNVEKRRPERRLEIGDWRLEICVAGMFGEQRSKSSSASFDRVFRSGCVLRIVAQVVAMAHEGVDDAKRGAFFAGQEEKGIIEIAAAVPGNGAASFVGFCESRFHQL